MKALVFKIPVIEDCSVYTQEDDLPYFYDHLHLHPEIQLTLILKGTGTVFAGNFIGNFAPGDIYWIASDQPHLFKCDPAYFAPKSLLKAHSLSIYFLKTGILGQLFRLPELGKASDFIWKSKGVYRLRCAPGAGVERAFREVQASNGSERIIQFLRLLQEFISNTTKETLSGEASQTLNEQECLRMNEIYQFTMKHFHEHISLEKAAAIAHMTPPAFCRYFKHSTRKTYMHFLNEVRIDHARKMIRSNKDIPLSGVAAACGFENASGFTRVFRRITGIAPMSYRKELLKGAAG
ncbi:AraC family transcriptional regulator [Anseongella ginsenosidimutans]|uniref:AraC family transcriptional regulator n=1 Tax=Anseongella ginsenosidimutans TaxID=496056 RepID=A0A4R3KWQ3_9SPHI|nr:AraC family transcriptional regulator [Anseongella ginsenosidimutans]QEC51260.1 helix-turn-helix domain-containing protein [Anseongella ginsenosidimutans]TCS90055.1 AraC family transcriptional regulator [Anseongella ginsenosidimutans]